MVEAKKAELEIEQKIAKETAELTKALNLRQEGMRELAIHRSRAKEDKRMLMEEKKVGVKTEAEPTPIGMVRQWGRCACACMRVCVLACVHSYACDGCILCASITLTTT